MAMTAPPSPPATPATASQTRNALFHALVRASGGPRYAVALAVDAVGTGLLRPFLLLYGIDVLRLPALIAGLAMTAGVVAGLGCTPAMGRWLDRGARSTAVAAAMLVRVTGTALLLAAPAGSPGTVWLFAAAALFLGIGNQAFPVAHAALVATVSEGRRCDAALAAGTGLSYLLSAALAWSVRVRASPKSILSQDTSTGPRPCAASAPRMRLLLAANVIYVFCLNVPEVALPLVLVTQLHASPMWAAGVFVTNTVLVVAFQVPVTVWMSHFSRRAALAISGIVLSVSYLGFLGGMEFGHGWAASAVVGVSVLCTLGEIVYAGSFTALVVAIAPEQVLGRVLARSQLSTGFGLAVSPAIITALAAHGPAALWASLAAATLLSAAAVTPGRSAAAREERGRQHYGRACS